MFPAGRPDIRTRRVALPNGMVLRVAESGKRDAPAVLLVHGWGASLYMWRDWFAPLAASGRRVIALDLPGHGLSDKPSGSDYYRLASLANTLRELIEVAELGKPDVVAQSMAGTIIVELASSEPAILQHIALVNPACFGRVRQSRFLRLVSPEFVDVILPRLVARRIVNRAHRIVYGDASLITSRDIDEYWAPSQFPSYARAMRRLLHEFPWSRASVEAMVVRLKTFDTRLLTILGTRDRLVLDALPFVSALQRAGSALVLEVIEGGGHAVNEELPERVVAKTLAFLDD